MQYFIHDLGDGKERRCTYHEHDGTWRHWDHEGDEPGPNERRDYVCRMDHPMAQVKQGPLPHEVDLTDAMRTIADQGTWGMPHMKGMSNLMLDPEHPFSPESLGRGGRPYIMMGRSDLTWSDASEWPERRITQTGVSMDFGEKGYTVDAQTDIALRILQEHLPLAVEHFLKRNAEYGEESHVLGIKGQFADINRKVIKLKRYLWDDEPVPEGAEPITMIAQELIGHLLILIDELESQDV